MNITLTAEQELWVKQQLDAGHFATVEDAIGFAINAAKVSDLRATLTASRTNAVSASSRSSIRAGSATGQLAR